MTNKLNPNTEDTHRAQAQQPQKSSRPLRAAGSPEHATLCHDPVASAQRATVLTPSSVSGLQRALKTGGRSACKGRIGCLRPLARGVTAAVRSVRVTGAQPASVQRRHRRASQDAMQAAELLLHHAQALLQPRVLIAQHAGLRPKQRCHWASIGAVAVLKPSRADKLSCTSTGRQTAFVATASKASAQRAK